MVCRNQLRIALRLATLTLLVVGVAIGFVVLKADNFLRSRVIAAIEQAVPHWDVDVADVRLDGAQALVYGLRIRPAGSSKTIAELPELIVTLDETALTTSQTIIPQHIRLRQPTVSLERYDDGSFNVASLLPLPESSGFSPMIEIDRATVVVTQAGRQLHLRDLDAQLRPHARKHYQVTGTGRLDTFGDVELTGSFDTSHKIYDVQLAARVRVDDTLVETAAAWHPTARKRIAEWSRAGVQIAAAGDGPDLAGIAGRPTLGLNAETDVNVQWSKRGDEPADWSVKTEIVRGEFASRMFPMPLRNLAGVIEIGSDGVRIDGLSAGHGATGFTTNGQATVVGSPGEIAGLQKVFELRANDVLLDGPLKNYLAFTPGLQTVHRLLNPHGRVDIVAKIDESGERVTQWSLVSLEIRDGSFLCAPFPYPVTNVTGWAKQVGTDVELAFEGRAGTRDVKITGRIIQAGPGAGFDIRVTTDGMPIDTQLKAAFDTKALGGVNRVIESLNLSGLVDGTVRFTRQPGVPKGTRPKFQVDIALRDGSLKYAGFPYRLEDASGEIHFDETVENVWRFRELSARRGDARVTAFGAFQPPEKIRSSLNFADSIELAPATLDLTLQADNVPYDGMLYQAVTHAVPSLGPVIDELQPAGEFAASDVRVTWVAGQKPDIALPEITVRDGRLRIQSFPFPLSDVEATLRRDGPRVVIESFAAKHDNAIIQLRTDRVRDANNTGVSYATPTDDGWFVLLRALEARELVIDQELLQACPPELAATLTDLNIKRPINLAGNLGVSHSAAFPTRVEAKGVIDFPGNDLTTGVDLQGVRGKLLVNQVIAATTPSGKSRVRFEGDVELDSARILDMAFSDLRGPLLYVDNESAPATFIVGDEAMTRSDASTLGTTQDANRFTASFYGGTVGFDLRARPAPDGVFAYDLVTTLRDGDLGLWAADQLDDSQKGQLQGQMNGEIRLSGRVDDIRSIRGQDGYLNISRARILELPAMVRMLSALKLSAPDNLFFRHGFFSFDVRDGFFDFDQIWLYNSNLSFVGEGRAYFRPEDFSEIDFNFASYVPPGQVPIIGPLMSQLSSRWLYVKLRGTIGNPIVQQQGRFPLVDRLSGVMKSVESGQFTSRTTTPGR